jgi:site-specific DNA-methyltransferase (adenine-specific)
MIKLIQGDCLQEMDKLIKEGIIVDAIITDPPYGTTACKWDSIIPFDEMWPRLNKLIKPNGAIVLFGSEPFSSTLRMSNIKNYKYDWIWKKSKGSNFPHAPNMPLKTVENISVFSIGKIGHLSQLKQRRMCYFPQGIKPGTTVVKQNKNTSELKYHRESQTNHTTGYKCKNENYPNVILEFKSENKLHPTQKPVPLMEYLIKTYTNEGETVLDFTMGSGTTMLACKNLNRNGIGIELDEKYYEIAKERCK